MNYYKLKEKYPGLPKDWEVGMKVGQGDRGVQGGFSPCNAKYSDNKRIPFEDVVSNPKYWEKVKEVNYHILSVVSNENNSVYGRGELQKIDNPSTYTHKVGESEKCPWDLHSVKRLSDGAIFEVGKQAVVSDVHKKVTSIKKDDSFWGGLKVCFHGERISINASYLKQKNNPLFTTKDGVDIYNGMTAFAVGLRGFELNKIFKVSRGYAFPTKNYVWFSTREVAEEFILMNKIGLTGQDMLDYLESVNLKVKKVDPAFIKFIKNRLKSRGL